MGARPCRSGSWRRLSGFTPTSRRPSPSVLRRSRRPWTLLFDASTAQHRTLVAHLDELARVTSGLDAVAITRTLHALLTVYRDLEDRILDVLPGQAPTT